MNTGARPGPEGEPSPDKAHGFSVFYGYFDDPVVDNRHSAGLTYAYGSLVDLQATRRLEAEDTYLALGGHVLHESRAPFSLRLGLEARLVNPADWSEEEADLRLSRSFAETGLFLHGGLRVPLRRADNDNLRGVGGVGWQFHPALVAGIDHDDKFLAYLAARIHPSLRLTAFVRDFRRGGASLAYLF